MSRSSVLSVRARAAWSEPARPCLPTRLIVCRGTNSRLLSPGKNSIRSFRLQPLWPSRLPVRSTPSCTSELHSSADSSVESVGTQHKRTTVDDAVLIQGRFVLRFRWAIEVTANNLQNFSIRLGCAGFAWTSCDQEGWYDQIRLKLPELKVCNVRKAAL